MEELLTFARVPASGATTGLASLRTVLRPLRPCALHNQRPRRWLGERSSVNRAGSVEPSARRGDCKSVATLFGPDPKESIGRAAESHTGAVLAQHGQLRLRRSKSTIQPDFRGTHMHYERGHPWPYRFTSPPRSQARWTRWTDRQEHCERFDNRIQAIGHL